DGDDCDDGDAASYPGAAETCGDGVDQDCDGRDVACPEDSPYFRPFTSRLSVRRTPSPPRGSRETRLGFWAARSRTECRLSPVSSRPPRAMRSISFSFISSLAVMKL
ncbi:MAG: hypothetical protein EXR71_18645, partial [Myxococcales bacterium]|nr:hypothetical protein [Myxococcales bacterium]